jgi:molybdopterin/thiamine biosynthesis adenylyltransferase
LILSKDQINRYMRHIAMPSISGKGQKKLLDSSLVFFAEDLRSASLSLYYAAASGVGNVYCRFNDVSGWDRLYGSLMDLNSDTVMHLFDEKSIDDQAEQAMTGIISGPPVFVEKTLHGIIKSDSAVGRIPLTVCIHNGWRGFIKTLADRTAAEKFSAELSSKCTDPGSADIYEHSDLFSGCFSGLMAVIEHIKLTLAKGKPLTDGLYFDLSVMEFDFSYRMADSLRRLQNLSGKEAGIKALAGSKALIVGCGGLGSPAAFALAASGIGGLGLIDFDKVEISNLNRQIMHSTSRIGMPKVNSAEIFLKEINPQMSIEKYNARISKGNVRDIISSYDIIIGGLDNLPTRYILNDACYAAGKPYIEAGALDISGLVTTIIPNEGHCYRCIFPETEDNNTLPSCSETGVLGPVPGVMGVIEAAEAVKLLTGTGESLKDRILLFDVFDTDIYVTYHGRNKYCELCGDKQA